MFSLSTANILRRKKLHDPFKTTFSQYSMDHYFPLVTDPALCLLSQVKNHTETNLHNLILRLPASIYYNILDAYKKPALFLLSHELAKMNGET